MQHPRHEILAAKREVSTQRIVGIVFVGLLHMGLIYAIASGLAVKFVKQLPHDLTAQVIPVQQQDQQPPPPKPQLEQPKLPTVAPPVINIQTEAPAPTISVAVAPHPAPTTAPTQMAAKGIASTHTIPPYPEVARRLGQQGTVTLKITIAANGAVADAEVAKSSGVPTLDAAAVAWVKSHWKYKPALAANGQPIASVTQAAVVFDLKKAR